MNKVLLVLPFVALSLSGAWASSIQDDDLIDFELVVRTSDGESWIGAPGVKIKYADSKAISAWRRDQERGGHHQAAVEAIGKTAESGPGGAVKLRVPDKRLSFVCELDGLVTFKSFSAREVKAGRAEMPLQNGAMELLRKEVMDSLVPGAISIAAQLVDEDGQPIRYRRVHFLAFVTLNPSGSESEDADELAFSTGTKMIGSHGPYLTDAPYLTDKEGRVEFPFKAGGLSSGIDGFEGNGQSSDELLTEQTNYARIVLHLRAEDYEFVNLAGSRGETDVALTSVIDLAGPFPDKRIDLGTVTLSEPPIIITGKVTEANGAALNLVEVHVVALEEFGPHPRRARVHLEFFHFAWKGMKERPDTFDRYTFEEGLFELRGRLFMDDVGLVPATLPPRDDKDGEHRFREGEIILAFVCLHRLDDLEQGKAFEFPIGARDVRVVMKPK